MASKRILKDLKDLQKDPPTSCSAGSVAATEKGSISLAENGEIVVISADISAGAPDISACFPQFLASLATIGSTTSNATLCCSAIRSVATLSPLRSFPADGANDARGCIDLAKMNFSGSVGQKVVSRSVDKDPMLSEAAMRKSFAHGVSNKQEATKCLYIFHGSRV